MVPLITRGNSKAHLPVMEDIDMDSARVHIV